MNIKDHNGKGFATMLRGFFFFPEGEKLKKQKLWEGGKKLKASEARTAQVGIVTFCCLELILWSAREQAGRITRQESLLATLQARTTANTQPGAGTAPGFPHQLQPLAGFSAWWGKKRQE